MADISKCKGTNCPVATKCYRYTAKDGMRQSYFLDVPGKTEDGKFTCDYFWGEKINGVWQELKDILNEKEK